MLPFKRILCPTDFSEPAFIALKRAEELAIHAEKVLKELVSHQVSPEVRTRDLVTTGEAAPEIIRIAQQEHADLIVIASHGLTGWRRLVFGSVAEKVVRQATCPVLTIMAPA